MVVQFYCSIIIVINYFAHVIVINYTGHITTLVQVQKYLIEGDMYTISRVEANMCS